jgi:hypothetical protein
LSKTEFIEFFTRVIHELNSPMFTEQLLAFLNNSIHVRLENKLILFKKLNGFLIKFDYPQRVRGENRQMWLNE